MACAFAFALPPRPSRSGGPAYSAPAEAEEGRLRIPSLPSRSRRQRRSQWSRIRRGDEGIAVGRRRGNSWGDSGGGGGKGSSRFKEYDKELLLHLLEGGRAASGGEADAVEGGGAAGG
ncbi:hypothetical protein ACHAWF_006029 [Thalassiosira exigua]